MTAQQAPLMGKSVAFLATDGVEEVEYTQSRAAAEQAGAEVDLLSVHPEPIQSVRQDINPSNTVMPRGCWPRRTWCGVGH
jgi:protease I